MQWIGNPDLADPEHWAMVTLKKIIDHKTGQSQNKLASKFKVSQATISKTVKRVGVKYRKRKGSVHPNKMKLKRDDKQIDFKFYAMENSV